MSFLRSRALQIILILLVIILAAFVRVADLSRLPAGFMDEEIANLRIAETVRTGSIGVFYDLKTPEFSGRESFFPLLVGVLASLIGDGLLGFRILPLICGLASVALFFVLAKRLYGFSTGLLAALICAGGLYPVLLSRLVIPQTLLLPLLLATVLAFVNGLHLRETIRPLPPKTSDFTALAICAVLCFYTHYTGLMLIPAILVFTVYLRRTRQPLSRYLLRAEAYAALLALILCLPYILSTIRAFEVSGFGAYVGYRPETAWALFSHVLELLRSLLNFGAMGIPGLLLILGSGALILLGIMTGVQRRDEPRYVFPIILLIIGLLPAMWTGRGDYNLTVALPGAVLLLAIGGMRVPELFIRNYARRMAVRRVAWLSPIIAIATFAGMYSELFVRWPADVEISRQFHGYLGHVAVYLDAHQDNVPTLICSQNIAGSPEQPVADPILMDFMIHRSDVNVRFSVCETAIILANGGKRQRVVYNFDSAGETPAALREWLRTVRNVQLIQIDGLRRAAAYEIDGETELADALGRIIQSYAEWPPDLPNPDDPVLLPVRMGDNLTFDGYSLQSGDETRTFKPGETLVVTTYWRIDGRQRDDLRLFTHLLLDPGSAPAAQNDLLDVASNYLRPRDIVIQTSVVQIPYPFPEGRYYLSVGAYHTKDNQRVPFFDDTDRIRGDRLFLGTIEIKG